MSGESESGTQTDIYGWCNFPFQHQQVVHLKCEYDFVPKRRSTLYFSERNSDKKIGPEMITDHMFLPHCWICNVPWGPNTKEHKHHVIPRAYGGTDGPQVSLCDSHHSALHEIALKLYSKKPFNNLLTSNPEQDRKLLYLASVAYNSRIAVEHDPNKRRVEIIQFKQETFKKLKHLQTIHKISREKLIELAIVQMHSRYFK